MLIFARIAFLLSKMKMPQDFSFYASKLIFSIKNNNFTSCYRKFNIFIENSEGGKKIHEEVKNLVFEIGSLTYLKPIFSCSIKVKIKIR